MASLREIEQRADGQRTFGRDFLKILAQALSKRRQTTPAMFAEWREGASLDRERQFAAAVRWVKGESRELAVLCGVTFGGAAK
jgi:hypothetical protein